MSPIVVFLGIAAVIGAIAYAAALAEKKRAEALQALATSLGFSFSRKDDRGLLPTLGKFQLFTHGHSKRISNIMQGAANAIDVTIMEYRYTTGSGKNSHTYSQTVILFRSPLLRLPGFTVRPENLFHKIGKMFGFQDIDFTTHPAFSKQYLLRGADEAAVRALFGDELLAWFEQSKGLSAEGEGNTLVFYRASKRVPPEGIQAFMQEGFGVFALVKSAA